MTKRRGYGSGSLREIRPGVWELRAGGRSRTFRGKRKDAERALAALVANLSPRAADCASATVDDLLIQWRQTAQLEPGTWETYTSALAHLPEPFGARKVAALAVPDFDRLYAALARDGVRPQVIRKLHTALGSALTEAVRWQWIHHHPAHRARLPKLPDRKVKVPDARDVTRLLAAATADPQHDTLVWLRLALGTGARRGEVLALRWSDVDLETRTVTIRASMNEDRSTKSTKTNQQRTVVVDQTTADVLRRWRIHQAERALAVGAPLARDPWVLSQDPTSSQPWRPDGATQRFRRLCERAGVDGVRLHDLRHFHASALLRAGTPAKVVSGRLGHTTTRVTMDLYGWVMDGDDRAAADTLGRILEA